jgi:hypothetical protein
VNANQQIAKYGLSTWGAVPQRIHSAAIGCAGLACASPEAMRFLAPVLALVMTACSSSLPGPPATKHPDNAFLEVPHPPPPARVEIVPAKPSEKSVWVDGQWVLQGQRWVWEGGGWVEPPAGASHVRWQTRRDPDGRLLFAPGSWRRSDGTEIPPPPILAPPPNIQPAAIAGCP